VENTGENEPENDDLLAGKKRRLKRTREIGEEEEDQPAQ
jgi:hypothetical protein